jgi:Fe-S oxidoreductase/nitrate reductase gamma subunit
LLETDIIARPVFYALPTWVVIAFYLACATALGVFAVGVYRKVRRYARGRVDPDVKFTWRSFGQGLAAILPNRAILAGDVYAGIAHLCVFWGFAGLFVATILVLVDNDFLHFVVPQWQFLNGSFYLVFSWLADFSGVLLLAGLLLLATRRSVFRLPFLKYQAKEGAKYLPAPAVLAREDWLFLGWMGVLAVGGFLLEGFRIRATEPSFERASFLGWQVGEALAAAGLTSEAARNAFAFVWCFHALTALALVAWIPYSKAWHMLAAWYTAAFKHHPAARTLPAAPEGESGGYARVEDLTRTEQVMLDACTRCGRCHARCPATTAGFPLSPRDLVQTLRAFASRPVANTSLAGGVVPETWLWSCTSCLSCVEHCPVGVWHVPLIVQMRRFLVAQGQVDKRLQESMQNLTRYGNSFGSSPRARPKWTQELPFKIKDARKEAVDCLWITGDYAAFDPRVTPVTRGFARLLNQAGVDFGILYEAEQNSGNDIRRTGEEGLFEVLRDKNVAAIEKAGHQRLITTDPHAYHALKNEYGWTNGNGRVAHYTEVLDELIGSGKLPVLHKREMRVTYHDPCYLGRYNGLYDAPRNVLRALGATLVEMPRNRDRSFCCGAGGGRIWMEDSAEIKERPAENRVREAATLAGVTTLVVSCPKDLVMFQDALKTTGLEGKLEVKDIAQLVEQATG